MKNNQPIPFYGDGSTARDYTYIDDIIDGIFGAMNGKDQFAIYNLGNSDPVKLDELVHVIGERLGCEPILDRHPLPAGDVIQTFADVSRAKSRLDYEPQVRIDDGISQFIEWFDRMVTSHGELFS
jgi:UDP-glucuronate 4-epimerase